MTDAAVDIWEEQLACLRRLVGGCANGVYEQYLRAWLRQIANQPPGWSRDGLVTRAGAPESAEGAMRGFVEKRLAVALESEGVRRAWVPRLFQSNADAVDVYLRLTGPVPDVADVTAVHIVSTSQRSRGRRVARLSVGVEFGHRTHVGERFGGGRMLPVFVTVHEVVPADVARAARWFDPMRRVSGFVAPWPDDGVGNWLLEGFGG